MPRKANYPDWVSKHLKKGLYVNCQNGRYYLYAAHSEREKGVSHPVRHSDGYLGRITEDGFIPSKKNRTQQPTADTAKEADETPTSYKSFSYGVPACVVACSEETILRGLRRSYRRNGTAIYVRALCQYLYGFWSPSLYARSYLSLKFPGVQFPENPSSAFLSGVERGTAMLKNSVQQHYQDDWVVLRAHMEPVCLLWNGHHLICPELSEEAVKLKEQYRLPIGADFIQPWESVCAQEE